MDKTGMKAIQLEQTLHDIAEEQPGKWSYLLDITVRAASYDESYMRRRRFTNRMLKLVGIERSDAPDKAPISLAGTFYAATARLEREGVIEKKWEYPIAAHQLEAPAPRRMVYRLLDQESLDKDLAQA